MRSDSRGKTSPYEVRCPRCDVSFPVETKTCFHCGGPTGPPGVAEIAEPVIHTASGEVLDDAAIDPYTSAPESPFSAGDSGLGDFEQNDRALESMEGEEAPSLARSLFRSLGGLIWIILLIAFSLARDCGE